MADIISLDTRRRRGAEARVDQLCAAVDFDHTKQRPLDARHVDGSVRIHALGVEIWESPDGAEAWALKILDAVEKARAAK